MSVSDHSPPSQLASLSDPPTALPGQVMERSGSALPASLPPALRDPHLRGRRLVSPEIARSIAQSELPPWDHGLSWGGLTLASRCAATHFCVVGAPGSGKTMLLRLLMQSALSQVGRASKTKEVTRVVEIPSPASTPLAAAPAAPLPLPPFVPPLPGHPLPLGFFTCLSAAMAYGNWPEAGAKDSVSAWAWVAWTVILFAWTLHEADVQSQGQKAMALRQRQESRSLAPTPPAVPTVSPSAAAPPTTRTERVPGPIWAGHRAVVYDAKQDIFSLLHGMEGVHCPIYTLNPFDKRCVAWDMAQDITAPATAQQIATILIPENQNASQPFFTDAARHLLTGAFIALMKKAGTQWEFRDVILALKSRKNLVALLEDVPETRDLIEQYLPLDESGRNVTAHNILSALATKMAPFEFVAAAWNRAETKVSLRHWLQNEYILVLGNDEAHRAALDAINRVIFKRLSELILAGPETDTARTWIFLDEVREAGDLEGLGRLMTKGRSKGAAVVLGFQDMEGLRDSFGEKRAHEIVAMCATKAVLRLESPETAKWASELFGEFEAFEDKQGWSQGQGKTSGEAHTTGTSTTRGLSSSRTRGSGYGGGSVSSNDSTTNGDNTSETDNRSESTNTSQSQNWNESLNRERVQRAALLPSQFLSLPATNPKNGLTGYFVSPFTGAYEGHIAGETLDAWLHLPDAETENVEHRHDSHQYILAWDETDFKRLKTRPGQNSAPEKDEPSKNETSKGEAKKTESSAADSSSAGTPPASSAASAGSAGFVDPFAITPKNTGASGRRWLPRLEN